MLCSGTRLQPVIHQHADQIALRLLVPLSLLSGCLQVLLQSLQLLVVDDLPFSHMPPDTLSQVQVAFHLAQTQRELPVTWTLLTSLSNFSSQLRNTLIQLT